MSFKLLKGMTRGLKKEKGYDVMPIEEFKRIYAGDPKDLAAILEGERLYENSRQKKSTAQSYANAARSERTMRGSRGRARGGHSGSSGTILGKKR